MIDYIDLKPLKNEVPSAFADRLGEFYSKIVDKNYKKIKGQFFTPLQISQFMGKLSNYNKNSLNLLDPGCGTGILSCSLIEYLILKGVKNISLTAYETDLKLIPYTKLVFSYLKTWLSKFEIYFTYHIYSLDFILENSSTFRSKEFLSLFKEKKIEKYDLIISNPPYFKLQKEDIRVKALHSIINGQPNIYALFLATSANLLKKGGELIFIIPRSFTSGRYFKSFRSYFFSKLQINHIHLFVSRKETFNRDKVLQETLILKASKEKNGRTVLSTSYGLDDLDNCVTKEYKTNKLIDLESKSQILHLPTNKYEESVINLFRTWDKRLIDYNIQISTGPVVAFRAKEYIFDIYSNGIVDLVPLLWLHNVEKMKTTWPIEKNNKGQYIDVNSRSQSLLVKNKNYVLLRRFSSKDDKSRLVSSPFFYSKFEARFIGFENKLNYIYKIDGELTENEIIGLSAILNTKLFDTYFRTFNGNVNVSATEIREMPIPNIEIIRAIGEKILLEDDISIGNVNKVTEEFLNNELAVII